MTERSRAWAAGIVDGEGCILASETQQGCALRVTVRMVHKPTIQRLCWLFGGRIYRLKTTHRTAWQWSLAGQQAATALRKIVRYMVTKEEEVRHLLALAEEQKMRGNQPAPRVWQRVHIDAMKKLKRKEWR